MTSRNRHDTPQDPEALAVNAFKAEGAFLHTARIASDALAKRLERSPAAATLTLSRDELTEISRTLARAVDIGCEYHIDVAEIPAA